MRRGFVVLALLATMVGLRALQTDGAAGGDPMTLAAIGFVVLAAFAVAELGGRLGLPRVTGYIVSGVALGPFALGVLSPGTVGDLEMFSTLALGLIATSAGLELDLRGLRSLARTLGVTIAVKVALGLLVVGGAVFAIESQFDVLGLAEAGPRVAVAVVIAALTIGTSPAIALALISETGAKGRLADLVLGAAVVKDLVVVIALAVAVATGRAVLSGDAFDVAVLGHVGLDLAGSATAGAALGALLIAYVRYVKAEMLLFVAAMVLVVAEVSTALHLEVLLVFIVAGAVVRNYSRYEHDLLHPLHMVSLPVFIVFFTTAGANVDVAATIGVLPLALTVCLLRAGVYAIAGRIGGRVGGEEPVVRRLAWLGYLPQAGVALGLLAIAVDQLPEIAGPLATLGMAVIAINLMVGPITLRTALTRAGDASRPAPAPVEPPRDAGASSFGGARPLADLALHEIVATLDAALRAMLEGPIASPLERWLRDRVELARPALSGNAGDAGRGETHARAASVLAAAARLQADDGVPDVNGMLDAFDRQLERLLTLPTALVTPLDPALARVAPNDPVVVKLRKRGAWFADAFRLRLGRRTRRVDVCTTARGIVAPRCIDAIERSLNRAYRAEAALLDRLRMSAAGATASTDASAFVDAFVQACRDDLASAAGRIVAALSHALARTGAPGAPTAVRFSRVAPEIQRARDRIVGDARQWPGRRAAAVRLLRVTAEVAVVEGVLLDTVQDRVIATADTAIGAILTECNGEARRLTALRDAIATAATAGPLDAETKSRLQMSIDALVPRQVDKRLRTAASDLRRATSESLVTVIHDAVADHTDAERVVPSLARLAEAPRPANVELMTLDVGDTVTGHLSAKLLPELEELLAATWAVFATTREAMTHAQRAVAIAWDLRQRETEDATSLAEFGVQIDVATAALTPAMAHAEAQWPSLRERLLATVDGVMPRLLAEIERAAALVAGPTRSRGRLSGGLARRRAAGRRLWDTTLTKLRGWRSEVFGRLGERVRLRSGIDPADATEVRAAVDATAGAGVDLPEAIDAAFTLDPVRDPRIFAARRGALAEVLAAERAWIRDPAAGNGALVVSPTGQGKTSLLRIARFDLKSRRVIVVPARAGSEQTTMLGYLGHELRCAPAVEALSDALGRGRAAIAIDDLHAWVGVDPRAGLRELEDILGLVAATRHSAFWLVSVASEALEAIELAVRVRSSFARVVRLEPLDAASLTAVIEARLRLAGVEVEYPSAWSRRWGANPWGGSPSQSFAAALLSEGRGSLRGAIASWRRLARVDAGRVRMERPTGMPGLPALRQFTALQLAVLVLLVRRGSRGLDEVVTALAVPRAAVEREVAFLSSAGLVERRDERLDLRDAVRDEVAAALVEFGALEEGRR